MKRVASIVLATGFCGAAALLAVAALRAPDRPTCHSHPTRPLSVSIAEPAPPGGADGEDEAAVSIDAATLKGLWSRHPDGNGREDAPVAFYYFHDDGIGLYRYGQIGHNTTNSYRWAVADHHGETLLVLSYNKTGEVQHLRVRLEQDGRRSLVITRDPKNPGAEQTRYVFVPPPSSSSSSLALLAPDLALDDPSETAPGIDHRLWIDERRFKTGGMGFSLYQFRKAGIDGRGTGWHHVGDYDDWSTESLSYRLLRGDAGIDRIDLAFTLRGDRTTTSLALGKDARGGRTLTLATDPRDFGASHTFKDGGPSFAVFIAPVVRP